MVAKGDKSTIKRGEIFAYLCQRIAVGGLQSWSVCDTRCTAPLRALVWPVYVPSLAASIADVNRQAVCIAFPRLRFDVWKVSHYRDSLFSP
jgi:hypothetical protein